MKYRIVWIILAPALMVCYSYLCFRLLSSLVGYGSGVILYEPIGYVYAVIYSGFFSLLVIFTHRLSEVVFLKFVAFPNKIVRNAFLLGLAVGFLINHLNYILVIQKNNYIQCPVETGYKNNLMAKFVSNVDSCDN